MGMPWERRGARSEEHIALMRTLWTADGDTVEFQGEFWKLPPMSPDPRPVQRPIPVLIGGHSEVALDRAARIGDGWIAANMSAERFAGLREQLVVACERHGRRVEELRIVCTGGFPPGEEEAGPLGANPQRIVEELRRYEELGVNHLNVEGRARTTEATLEWLVAFSREVMPGLR